MRKRRIGDRLQRERQVHRRVRHSGMEPRSCPRRGGLRTLQGVLGPGLMPEAVRPMLRFGFERMGLNRIEARCSVENAASTRVMEKVGM
jgi:hypothetical protein